MISEGLTILGWICLTVLVWIWTVRLYIMKILAVAAFTVFIPLTAWTFYRWRLKKKELEYKQIVKALELEASDPLLPRIREEYSSKDYWVPVILATFICLLGNTALMLGGELKIAHPESLILAGPLYGSDDLLCEPFCRQSLLVLTMAFLGAYIWSIQDLLRRLTTVDLSHTTYYKITIRIIMAAFIALMAHFFLHSVDNSLNAIKQLVTESQVSISSDAYLAPIIAFLTGMFPERMLYSLREQIRAGGVPVFRLKGVERADVLSLQMIEGMTAFSRIRLSEVGIDNAQNLAEANLVELMLRTPFSPKQIIDWIGQAKLYVHFKNDFSKLLSIGIRTIFDFKDMFDSKKKIEQVAKPIEIAPLSLEAVYREIENDTTINELLEARRKLGLKFKGEPEKSAKDKPEKSAIPPCGSS